MRVPKLASDACGQTRPYSSTGARSIFAKKVNLFLEYRSAHMPNRHAMTRETQTHHTFTLSILARVVLLVSLCAALGIPFASAAETESERLAKLEAAVKALQEQNTALKREVSELKGGSHREASTKSSDGKTYIETEETEKKQVYVVPGASETKLVLGGFIQGQYEAGDVSAYDGRFPGTATIKTKDRFRLRRARINVSGDFAEQFDFKLEGDFELNDGGVTVRDANGQTLVNNTNRVAFDATDLFVNWHRLPEANIKVGQYKAPFGLEQLTSDTKLFTIERSQATEALTPERQIGIQVWGKPFAEVWPEQKDLLSYSAGIFNGNGRNTTTNDNNEYMYVARLESQLFAGKIAGQDSYFKVGGDYLTSRDDRGTNVSQTGNLIVGADGSLSAFVLPSADEREGYSFDATFHLGPFDLIGEYLDERFEPRTVLNVVPTFTRFDAHGYYVTGGVFVVPKKLQLVAKWESFDPGQVANDNLHSITGGVNYYIHGDDLKLMADYIHTWSDFRNNRPQFGDDQFDQFLVRLQVMF
jgi:phosphate-selective porin OprO and OprP